jgi:GT2 family glycosyltransferase
VTHNSASDLPGCLAALAATTHRPLEVVIVDCASEDDSVATARRAAPPGLPVRVVPLAENHGYAGGMNVALGETAAPFVLLLNADAHPAPDYVARLLAHFAADEGDRRSEGDAGRRVGGATGRLVRAGESPRTLDACGMRLTLTWRHLDRGSGEPDRGQLAAPERVFGATGAASLFRRAALDDCAVAGEVFDSAFHSFREDAELAFRLRERGWEIHYEPAAVALHRRWNLPATRRSMPPQVNFHSLKNRYLLRLYHQSGPNLLLTLVPALARDLFALFYVLLREPSSLVAYRWLWHNRRAILARRRAVRARRTVGNWAVDRWFFRSGEPL